MEAAGFRVAEFVALEFPSRQHLLVLCGKGNNGGDGLVAARHLEAAAGRCASFCSAKPEQLSGGAARGLPEAAAGN